MVSIQNNVLSTSFRSATHATDSTRNGCNPNNAANTAGRQSAAVIRLNTTNNRTVEAAWRRTFVRWCPQGLNP